MFKLPRICPYSNNTKIELIECALNEICCQDDELLLINNTTACCIPPMADISLNISRIITESSSKTTALSIVSIIIIIIISVTLIASIGITIIFAFKYLKVNYLI